MSKVTINLSQGLIEAEGTEDFVKEQIDQFQKSMLPTFKEISDRVATARQPLALPSTTNDVLELHDSNQSQIEPQFAQVFSTDSSGEIHILKAPGSSDREKTRNLALLYLLAKKHFKNERTATADELRDLAKKHGCLDETNFTKAFTKSSLFMVSGKENSQKTYELTVPGLDAAKALVTKASDASNT